jgi:hypothetical protein
MLKRRYWLLCMRGAGTPRRGLGGLAGGVADVEALDAQLVQLVHRQVQRLGQRAGARLLRALLGQQARQLQRGVLLRHLQPGAALARGLVWRRRAAPACPVSAPAARPPARW